eukprot:m.139311 g.139311  ORF g.139311 m.139311 type:complete len:295 (+) comp30047_c0_seq1:245-1129(+)
MSTRFALAAASGAGVVAATWFGGGHLNDRIVEGGIRELGGQCYSLEQCIAVRKGGRHHQPFRDELLGELGSIFRRCNVDIDRVKLAVVPTANANHFAASGTRLLPNAHAYVVIPESVVLNTSLSRVRCADAFETLDIDPNTSKYIMDPATRYEVAHEICHLKHEDFFSRVTVATASAALVLITRPFFSNVLKLPARLGFTLSMWTVVPVFFGYKYLCRRQEQLADSDAGICGYASGGAEFWARQIILKSASPKSSYLPPLPWRSHPPMEDRCSNLKSIAEDLKHEPSATNVSMT